GSLRIAASPVEEQDCRVQLAAMEADGWPASWYEGPEGRGLLIPSDGVFQPLTRCRHLATALVNEGIPLYEETPALEISGEQVVTPHGVIDCRIVIVAVDGRLEIVLPELAGQVRTARLQMLATAPAPEVSFPRPVYRRWGYEYWQQLPGGEIALGGFRDRGGDAEWTTTSTPSPAIQIALERFLREDLRVTAPITHHWAASVGYTRSGVPISQQVRPGVWAIGGYNGTGNIIGSLLGRRVARVVAMSLA
ncbi:MAG: NAD(P)/FAD-dependent oxidoreductase, partial [Acidobacteriota bacterium]